MYLVFRVDEFGDDLSYCVSTEQRRQIELLEQRLAFDPYVGDPLGYRFFREKKIGGKRVYYLIYEDLKAVLMVAISDKKAQQNTIDTIRMKLDVYYSIVREAVRLHGGYGHVSRPQGP